MKLCSGSVLALCGAVIVCTAVSAVSQPPSVPRLAVRQLDEASYVELAKQWKEYIKKNGESAEALVNLSRAYSYSDEMDAAVVAANRAVEVDPDHPAALALYGSLTASYVGDVDRALELLTRCREIAPDYDFGLIVLATTYMRLGDLTNADEVFATMYKERTIPQPLQDYAYNMLVGLPEGAVLLTYGDNDTYPALVLQAGMGFRTDVAVVVIAMLNNPEFTEALFQRYPKIKPIDDVKHDPTKPPHMNIVKQLVVEQKAPIFFSSAVNFDFVGMSTDDLYVEGFNLRASKRGLSVEESAQLLLDTYRLDSATDWNFPWALQPSVAQLLRNYVAAMIKLAREEATTAETKKKLLEKALKISEFHDYTRFTDYIERSLRDA